MFEIQLVVLAKAPIAGRVKTRLCPPLTGEQAAQVAAAAIADTVAAVQQVQVRRRLVALDGDPAGLVPAGFEVLPQRGGGLDERLAAAFDDVSCDCALPILLIGMDTPQVTPLQLGYAGALLASGRPVLGHASDGGWWALGLEVPDQHVFLGVPMSTDVTGREQEARMRERGLDPALLPVLRDIDAIEDLHAAVSVMPSSSHLAAAVRGLDVLVSS